MAQSRYMTGVLEIKYSRFKYSMPRPQDGGVSDHSAILWAWHRILNLEYLISNTPVIYLLPSLVLVLKKVGKTTRSHPEMVGDMSRVTLNFDVSKIPFVRF